MEVSNQSFKNFLVFAVWHLSTVDPFPDVVETLPSELLCDDTELAHHVDELDQFRQERFDVAAKRICLTDHAVDHGN